MTTPSVSVIVPAYRSGAFLREGIPRLLAQTYDDFEVVIVDDGSGDDTASVATGFAASDARVRAVILPVNGGVARARERAVKESTGEYLWFIDVDDAWPHDALERLVAAATVTDADVIVAGAEFVYQDGSTRSLVAPATRARDGREAFRMLLAGDITGHLWNKLFRRTVMAKASFTPARVQSDLIMVADALSHAHRVAFIPSTVYQYRLRSGSIITSTSQRAESLALIDAAVRVDAQRLRLTSGPDYRYFRARYIQLSGIKDALTASYAPDVGRAHLRHRRSSLAWSDVLLFARRRDAKRLALAATAKTSLTAHRALLRAADR